MACRPVLYPGASFVRKTCGETMFLLRDSRQHSKNGTATNFKQYDNGNGNQMPLGIGWQGARTYPAQYMMKMMVVAVTFLEYPAMFDEIMLSSMT